MNNGGDVLARGGRSANFAGGAASISSFEEDMIMRPEIVAEKYGLSKEEIEIFELQRQRGEKLPDLMTQAAKDELAALKISVVDKRNTYKSDVKKQEQKYPSKEYDTFRPVMDRVLVMRINVNEDEEELEDGSVRNKKTGFIVPSQYRQHTKKGIVLAIGDFVVVGGVKNDLDQIVEPGDIVYFGDYNSEVFPLDDAVVEKLCDKLQVNRVREEDSIRIVRIQDVRGIERPRV